MTLITTNEALREACESLKNNEFITVDTEFLRDKTYYAQLCLIQLAGDGENAAFAVDALVPGIDLSPIWELFADDRIMKVFHSARQDLEIIHCLSGTIPVPLFDTQVAAMVCGFGESVGYETLVKGLVGIGLDKSLRFCNWSKRPLSDRHIHYAVSDVTHLRTVYTKLLKILTRTGRTEWVQEEMATLLDHNAYITKPEEAWKRVRLRNSSHRFAQVIRELSEWREIKAQLYNVPRNHFIREEVLLEIASSMPKTLEDLQSLPHLGHYITHKKLTEELFEVIEHARTAPIAPEITAPKEVVPPTLPVMELLKLLLKMKSMEHNVAERLIASTQDLIYLTHATTEEEYASIPVMQGWRYDVFGKWAVEVKMGKLGVLAQDGQIILAEIPFVSA